MKNLIKFVKSVKYTLILLNITLLSTIYRNDWLKLRFNCWSSLIYNTRARHEKHEYDTSHKSMSATQVSHEQHKCNMRSTRTTLVRHECYTNDTSVKWMKKSDFHNDTNKNTFSHPYIYYLASEKLKEEEQAHSKNYLLEMSCFHAKMR